MKLLIILSLLCLLKCVFGIPQTARYKPNDNYQSNGRSRGINDDTVFIEAGKDNVGLQGRPDCPDALFGIPFVYFGETGKCYLAGMKGPCPENMRIFPQHGSSFGFCDCNCDAYLEEKYHAPRSYCTGRTEAGDIRSLAYVKRWKSCQPLLEQNNCPAGHWLAFGNDPKKGPICERAVCEVVLYDLQFYDQNSGRCERVEGQCRAISLSNRGTSKGTYQILDSDWVPVCVADDEDELGRAHSGERKKGIPKAPATGLIPLNCPLGSRYSRFTGNCEHKTYLGSGVG